MTSNHLFKLAQEVADSLSKIDGVLAVALGGSLARGTAHQDSDIDLGLYYDPDHPPSIALINQLATEINDNHTENLATGFGEWGPWANGGAWLKIMNQAVDWLYRDVTQVSRVLSACQSGVSNCYYYPGHPHGFHDHYYLAEVYYAHVLYDKQGVLSSLKKEVACYPSLLKKVLIEKYLWEADFSLQTSLKAAKRADVFYVTGGLFRCVACLIQVIFALNERYINNEKGAISIADAFLLRPNNFKEIVSTLLANPGNNEHELVANIKKLESLVEETEKLLISQ